MQADGRRWVWAWLQRASPWWLLPAALQDSNHVVPARLQRAAGAGCSHVAGGGPRRAALRPAQRVPRLLDAELRRLSTVSLGSHSHTANKCTMNSHCPLVSSVAISIPSFCGSISAQLQRHCSLSMLQRPTSTVCGHGACAAMQRADQNNHVRQGKRRTECRGVGTHIVKAHVVAEVGEHWDREKGTVTPMDKFWTDET